MNPTIYEFCQTISPVLPITVMCDQPGAFGGNHSQRVIVFNGFAGQITNDSLGCITCQNITYAGIGYVIIIDDRDYVGQSNMYY